MSAETIKTIQASFNILQEGRTYTGAHRKYLIDNAVKLAESEETKERIALREAFGYYGHGYRQLAKRMDLEEVQPIKLPNGQTTLIHVVPSNVTTQFSVNADGSVTHTQDVLETDSGHLVNKLHSSRVGGFSWACGGSDGGQFKPTIMDGFFGMDYVLEPGFSANRGYILESANSSDFIFESVAKAVGDDKVAEELLGIWQADALVEAYSLREQMHAAAEHEAELKARLAENETTLAEYSQLDQKMQATTQQLEQEANNRKALVDVICEKSPFFIPEEIKHAMLENDFTKAIGLFETAQTFQIQSLPLSMQDTNEIVVESRHATGRRTPEPHSVASAFCGEPL